MKIDELDLKLKLLSGEGIECGIGKVYPLRLKEIIDYGYSNYVQRLSLFTFELTDFLEKKTIEDKKIKVFDFLLALGDGELHEELENSLAFFLKQEVKVMKSSHLILVGEKEKPKILHRENFDNVREVIRLQNSLGTDLDGRMSKPKNDKAKKILERLEETRELVNKRREDEDGDIEINDIISAVASKSNSLNKLNVFDLTLYQLYDEFKRLDLIDNYHVTIKSMIAGAKKVTLKHWSSKLK